MRKSKRHFEGQSLRSSPLEFFKGGRWANFKEVVRQ